jgi:hypothetical protein
MSKVELFYIFQCSELTKHLKCVQFFSIYKGIIYLPPINHSTIYRELPIADVSLYTEAHTNVCFRRIRKIAKSYC